MILELLPSANSMMRPTSSRDIPILPVASKNRVGLHNATDL